MRSISASAISGLRFCSCGLDLLHRAHPAIVGDIEDDAVPVLIFAFVIGIGRSGAAGKIGGARRLRFFLCLVQIVYPDAKMIDARLLIALHFEKREIDRAIRQIDAAARTSHALEIEGLLKEIRGSFRIGNDQRDMAKLGHLSCLLILTDLIYRRTSGAMLGGHCLYPPACCGTVDSWNRASKSIPFTGSIGALCRSCFS